MKNQEKSIIEIFIYKIKQNPISAMIVLLSTCIGAVLGIIAYNNNWLG